MMPLPIVVRELREAARRRGTFRGRFMMALIAVGVAGFFIYLTPVAQRRSGFSMSGQPLFVTLATLLALFSALAGAGQCSDAISGEKREGTLGLLFLTDLKGADVVLGKLASSSLAGFLAILGAVPALAVALLLGGITAGQVAQTALAIIGMFLFSHATALCVSVSSYHRERAAGAVVAILCLVFLGFPIESAWATEKGHPFVAGLLEILNPAYPFALSTHLHGATRPGTPEFWPALSCAYLESAALLALASWKLPRAWQDKGVRDAIGWRGQWRQLRYGKAEERTRRRRSLVGVNPYLWLNNRVRYRRFMAWIPLIVIVGFWGCFMVAAKNDGDDLGGLYVTGIIFLNGAYKFMFAAKAAALLEEQKRTGTLHEILCGTTLTPREIIHGQWLALQRTLQLPMVAILIINVGALLSMGLLSRWAPTLFSADFALNYERFVIISMLLFVPDVFALGWGAMWWTMFNSKPRQGAAGALVTVLAMPALLVGVIALALALSSEFLGEDLIERISGGEWMALWFFFKLTATASLLILTRRKLLANFRALATPRERRPGFWAWLGRKAGLDWKRMKGAA